MKQPFLLILLILLIVGSILASSSSALFTAYADSSDSTWQLSVNGLVNHPSNFTLADLEAMPQTTVSTALYCVDYPSTVAAQGNWTGVKLWTLLNETGVLPGAIKVAFYATDGYSTDLTIDTAKSDSIILAYAKDGAPLSEVLRLVVPGHWGYKWIAQVINIELVDYSFTGKWESVGYSDDGIITQSNQHQTHPYPSPPEQTIPPAFPSSSPKESPTASPSTIPITNSTSQSPSTQSKNLTSQNFNLKEATTVISVVIVAIAAIALITIIKTKNSHYKNKNPDFSSKIQTR
jgi:hypothetical protein